MEFDKEKRNNYTCLYADVFAIFEAWEEAKTFGFSNYESPCNFQMFRNLIVKLHIHDAY